MIMASRSASEMSLTADVPATFAVAQDRDTIGDLANLTQPVRDVDDGRPRCRELADGREEELDGILRERRRRLVENQEPRRHGERLGELEQVAAGDAERRDAVLEMAQEVDVVEQRAHRFRRVGIAAPQMLEPDRHADVLGDRHVREERRMLMDDCDPELLRDRRRETGRRARRRRRSCRRRVPSRPRRRSSRSTCRRRSPRAGRAPRPRSTSNETSVSAAIAS